jgi:hypothetical protein
LEEVVATEPKEGLIQALLKIQKEETDQTEEEAGVAKQKVKAEVVTKGEAEEVKQEEAKEMVVKKEMAKEVKQGQEVVRKKMTAIKAPPPIPTTTTPTTTTTRDAKKVKPEVKEEKEEESEVEVVSGSWKHAKKVKPEVKEEKEEESEVEFVSGSWEHAKKVKPEVKEEKEEESEVEWMRGSWKHAKNVKPEVKEEKEEEPEVELVSGSFGVVVTKVLEARCHEKQEEVENLQMAVTELAFVSATEYVEYMEEAEDIIKGFEACKSSWYRSTPCTNIPTPLIQRENRIFHSILDGT